MIGAFFMSKITYEQAVNLFTIVDGWLIWDCPTKGRRIKGNRAGAINKGNGRVCVEIAGKSYQASHIIWLMNYGEFPKHRTTNADGNPLNNKIENIIELASGKTEITPELVRKLFTYNDGLLIWKERHTLMSRCTIGSEAGFIDKASSSGYRYVKIGGDKFKHANLVWVYHNGALPKDMLDHINNVRSDDRIENLRESNAKDNGRNKKVRASSCSGVNGVTFIERKNLWRVRINDNDGNRVDLGFFSDMEKAIKLRKEMEKFYDYPD